VREGRDAGQVRDGSECCYAVLGESQREEGGREKHHRAEREEMQ
jgi:hypothetical protein